MMDAKYLAEVFVRDSPNLVSRDVLKAFLQDFDIWDDDTADEVWYASRELMASVWNETKEEL